MTPASPPSTPEAVTAAPFARILAGSIPTDQGADARALALDLATLCDAHRRLVSVILYATGDRTDLLVLGSRAYGSLRRALLGSVSNHMLR